MSEALGPSDQVIVVGAGLSGWRLIEGLRREGFAGPVTLVGAEHHLPYDRPPLSKQVLTAKWPLERTSLATPERVSELDVRTRLGDAAVSLDLAGRAVTLASGERIDATHVVIATGVRARRLPFTADAAIHVLRTIDDLTAVLGELDAGLGDAPAVIIGGGFVGAEAATSLRARGQSVIVLEALERPLLGVVGPVVSAWLEPLAADAGVELRSGQTVLDVAGARGDLLVTLGDGDAIRASIVIVAVGAEPNTSWLGDAGLDVTNGVLCDEYLQSAPGIYAMGDVARFRWVHEPFDEVVRIEHWQVANDHASALAGLLAGTTSAPVSVVPYFWSDQYGKKIQSLGHPAPNDEVHLVAGSPEEGRWLALFSRGDVVSAAIALSSPRALMLTHSLVESHATLAAAIDLAPWAS